MTRLDQTSPAVARAGFLLAGGLLAVGFGGLAPDRIDACAPVGGEVWACGEAASQAFDRSERAETLLFGGRLDLNRALPGALEALPGVGPRRARAIVAERAKRPFSGVGDLVRVRGVGPRTLEDIQPWVEVRSSGGGEWLP